MKAWAHPILGCEEARALEARLFGGDETREWEAMQRAGRAIARAVLQDVASYEETQDTLALLKLLALGNQEVAEGKTKLLTGVVKRLRAKRPKP